MLTPRLNGVLVDPAIARAVLALGAYAIRAHEAVAITPEMAAEYQADLAALPGCRMPYEPSPRRPNIWKLIHG